MSARQALPPAGSGDRTQGAALGRRNPFVSLDEDGTLDNFAATDVKLVHFEALDDTAWYATVELNSGETWQLNFGSVSGRARGYANAERVQ